MDGAMVARAVRTANGWSVSDWRTERTLFGREHENLREVAEDWTESAWAYTDPRTDSADQRSSALDSTEPGGPEEDDAFVAGDGGRTREGVTYAAIRW